MLNGSCPKNVQTSIKLVGWVMVGLFIYSWLVAASLPLNAFGLGPIPNSSKDHAAAVVSKASFSNHPGVLPPLKAECQRKSPRGPGVGVAKITPDQLSSGVVWWGRAGRPLALGRFGFCVFFRLSCGVNQFRMDPVLV